MENVLFALTIEDGWPPVATEALWCTRAAGHLRLNSIPLFLRGLAYGDLIAPVVAEASGHVVDFEVIEISGHSLIWMLNAEHLDIAEFIAELEAMGCKIATGLLGYHHYAIDVPPDADIAALDGMISVWDTLGLAFAYPAWRHDD
ncbi:MAG: DUF4265 domain-containing protein [Pseudomonadota bacterium]